MLDRIDNLRSYLTDSDTAILITSDVNRFYISSFRSSAGAVLVTNNTVNLFVDFRYYEAALNSVPKDINVVLYRKLTQAINDVVNKEHIKCVYIEESFVSVNDFQYYSKELECEVVSDFQLSDKLLQLRSVKSEAEVKSVVEAQKIAEKSFSQLLNHINEGVTERELALELEHLMKKYGAEKTAFDIIAVSGMNSSLPHGVPTDKKIKNGEFITFDFGCVVNGYHSDMTRTVALSYVTDEMCVIYDTVLKAHNLAAQSIKAGVTCADIDNAARDYIISKGYGDYFGHSTGHGVGLEIHEKPTVYKTNNCVLHENSIITVEPGIYMPGQFGVRIEDMYLVTNNGFEDLATLSKELLIL